MIARVAAIVLALATASGHLALCEGWKASPASRMACCAEGVQCPMRHRPAEGARHRAAPSQADADACCAASENDQTSPASAYALPALVPAIPIGPALTFETPSPVRLPIAGESPPRQPVPRHLLLSVFLV